ncbi:MAG: cupin domain-containing protein [Gammaproteobacteria bacterium]|nr:cupin domain-containing protein [Gammaproteobacteria bacterium]
MAQTEQLQLAEPRVVFNIYNADLGLPELQLGIHGTFWHGQTISLAAVHFHGSTAHTSQLHQHNEEHAVYCLRGEVEINVDGEQWRYGQDDALILPGNTPYQLRPLGDDTLLLYYFTARQSHWGPEGEPLPTEVFPGCPAAGVAANPSTTAKPRLYSPRPGNTEQVTAEEQLAAIPGTLELSHIFGQELSLGYFSMDKGSPYPAPHSHGEEIALQLRGHCMFHALGNDYPIPEGGLIIIPPGVEHSGSMFFDGRFSDDQCIMVSIQHPPRYEWGPEQN